MTSGDADLGTAIPQCDKCEDGGDVYEAPEAGYWTCDGCGARGSGREEPIWWHNDPDSMWYESEKA